MQIMTIFIFNKIFKIVNTYFYYFFLCVITMKFQNGRIFEQEIYITVVGFELLNEILLFTKKFTFSFKYVIHLEKRNSG